MTLEAKLAQQMSGPAKKTLFQVFLDVQKEYDSLCREQCLELLRGYSMGTSQYQIQENYWRRKRIFPKLSK